MFTLMKSYVAVTVFLFVGSYQVYGQLQPDPCTERFAAALSSHGENFCSQFDIYMECVIRERSLHVLGAYRDFLRNLQQSIEGVMASLSYQCDVNVFSLVRKVRAEDLAEAAAHNVSHIYAQGVTEFSEATNIGECTNAYVYHVTHTGAVTCEHTIDYTKCVLLNIGAHDFTDGQIEDFQTDVDGTLVLLGLSDCVIDTRSIVDKLRNLSAITRNKRATGSNPADSQTPLQFCMDYIRDELTNPGQDFCNKFESYLKCTIRSGSMHVLGFNRGLLRDLQTTMDTTARSLPVQCDVNIFGLVREVRVEDLADAAANNVSHGYAQGVTEFSEANSIGECANAYVYHVTNTGAVSCEDTTEYVACILRVFYTPKFHLSEEELEDYARDINATLDLLGLNDCVMNYFQLVLDANRESTNSTVITLRNAKTANECREAFVKEAQAYTDSTAVCSSLVDVGQCLIRVLDLPNAGALATMEAEKILLDEYEKLGLHQCSQVLYLVIEKLHNLPAHTTTTTPTTATITTAASLETTTTSASQMTDLHSARTANECRDAFAELAQNYRAPICEAVSDFAICLVKVLDMPHAGFRAIEQAHSLIHEQLVTHGLNCWEEYNRISFTDLIKTFVSTTTSESSTTTAAPSSTTTAPSSTTTATSTSSLGLDLRTASTVEECRNAYLEFILNFNGPTCPVMIDFAICLARVLDLKEEEAGSPAILRARDIIRDLAISYGQNCATEFHFIFRNIIRTAASSSTTVSPSVSTTTTANPMIDLHSAKTANECRDAFAKLAQEHNGPICVALPDFALCLIHVLDIPRSGYTAAQQAHDLIYEQLITQALNCWAEYEYIFTEIIRTSAPTTTTTSSVRTSAPSSATTTTPSQTCVPDATSGCSGLTDGDYQVCSRKCRYGIYVTCSNGHRQVRYCPNGWYRFPSGNPLLGPLVFDPATRTCQYQTRYCPRPLDSYLVQ